MELLIFALGFVLWIVTIRIAVKKGRGWFLWAIYAGILQPIAIIHALLMSDEHKVSDMEAYEKGLIQCPSCLEWVKLGAKVCRYCHSPIPENAETPEDRLRANGYGGIVVPKKPTKKQQDNKQ